MVNKIALRYTPQRQARTFGADKLQNTPLSKIKPTKLQLCSEKRIFKEKLETFYLEYLRDRYKKQIEAYDGLVNNINKQKAVMNSDLDPLIDELGEFHVQVIPLRSIRTSVYELHNKINQYIQSNIILYNSIMKSRDTFYKECVTQEEVITETSFNQIKQTYIKHLETLRKDYINFSTEIAILEGKYIKFK